ncbi:MAG: ATP-binding protein [Candidatus Nomurabacteria bacterium]|nr:ATP-binding protein [Candidatus Nomurabacteria bacterium]
MIITVVIVLGVLVAAALVSLHLYRKKIWGWKNFERSLKMVTMMINLPPTTDDVDGGNRDQRDVTEETISQSQSMYSIISSIALKGFKSRLYGQRHISFELVASNGIVHFYVTSPHILADTIEQAILAAYPTASLQRMHDENIFNEVGKINGTMGGDFSLKKEYAYPIATYQDTKKDAMRAILNVMSQAGKEDGVALQIMIRPAQDGWRSYGEMLAKDIREHKKKGFIKTTTKTSTTGWGSILSKPLESKSDDKHEEVKPLSKNEEATIEMLEGKTQYAAYETLVRVITSSNTNARAQTLLNNMVSVFSQFDSPTGNGFKFNPTKDVQKFVTSYIMRTFSQSVRSNILNTIELATIFHLPDQSNIPTSALERQEFKQVDGPTKLVEDGLLLGFNVFRGVEKPIRLSVDDRRRHIYMMGSTGMGKTVWLTNLVLQDLIAGRGFCFIDPHGDAAERILGMIPKDRVEDVIYFDPGNLDHPIGMNIFEIDPDDPDKEKTKDYIISETVGMLYSLYDPNHTGIVGPRMENIVRNAAHILMDSPEGGTFMDIPKVIRDPEFTKARIKYLTNQDAIGFWTQEWPAAQRSNEAGEVSSWVISKWAQFQTTMMRNILGQMKSGLNLRGIMDGKKILIVNVSKGKLGEVNSKLLGMLFVMKFQAAAMSRENIPEEERQDFCLYVDEFQNFATDSFESILSEARKFRLNLIVVNQFMTQLTDKIRSAIIGNAGSFVVGRMGYEDAEQMVKQFSPTFDTEDLQRMPNRMAVCKVLIDGYPSRPFTMKLPAPMGNSNPQLADAVKRLSSAKYGRTRAEVEAELNARLNSPAIAADREKQDKLEQLRAVSYDGKSVAAQPLPTKQPQGSSFLNDWMQKRQQIQESPSPTPSQKPDKKPPQANVLKVDRDTTGPAQSPPSAPMNMNVAQQPFMPPAPIAQQASHSKHQDELKINR